MSHRNSNGFTLIEILVSIVVIGVGLLGTARMQMLAIQNTQGGYFRAQASNIGYDIIDRMQGSCRQLYDGGYGAVRSVLVARNY